MPALTFIFRGWRALMEDAMPAKTPLLKTMVLRAVAVVLAPALFVSAFGLALATIPLVGIEAALSRS